MKDGIYYDVISDCIVLVTIIVEGADELGVEDGNYMFTMRTEIVSRLIELDLFSYMGEL